MVVAAFAGIVLIDDEADATPAEFTQVVYKIDDNNVKADPVSGDTFVAKSPEELGLSYKGTFQYWACGELVFIPEQSYSTTLEGAASGSITLTANVLKPTTVEIVNGEAKSVVAVADVINTIKGMSTDSETADFVGWLYSGDNKVYVLNEAKDKLILKSDKTTELIVEAGESLTAQYETIYKVEWFANGVLVGEGTTAVGGSLGMPAQDPDRDNYVFVGWFDEKGIEYDPEKADEYKFVGDTKFTAKYEPVNVKVTFTAGQFTKEVLVPYGTTVAPIERPTGYAYWAIMVTPEIVNEDGTTTPAVYEEFDFTTPITEAITLYAIESDPEVPDESIYATFNIEGTIYGPYKVTDRFSIPQTDREGYIFLGWTVQGGDGTRLTSEQVQNYQYTEDVTFVAIYEVAEPPAPEEPAFYKTTTGQVAIVIVVFALLFFGYAVYSNMGGIKDKLFGYTISKKEKKE